MDKKYNLLYIHELVQKHIQSALLNWKVIKLELYHDLLLLKSCKEPYGVNSQQKNVLNIFEKSCDDISPSDIKQELIQPKTLSYKEYKDKVIHIDKWNKQDSKQILFYPLFMSQFETIINDYKTHISKPVIKNFSQRGDTIDNKNTESKELQDYLLLMNECFDKKTVEQICLQTSPKEEKTKLVFENNVSARAKKYLDISSSDPEDQNGGNDDDDDDSKNKVYSGIHFTDLSRVNVNQKYKYEKKCHFRDTVKQYQGLQNKFIPDNVITDVIHMIKTHGLYDEKKTDDHYHKLTKDHVRSFLSESGHSKFYEDIQLIFNKITGKPCPNISKYEQQLYGDFDSLVDAFLSLDIKRKNFLNSHYVLRQLLLRQGIKVPNDDLTCLKTLSRLQSHDDFFQRCCQILKWNFSPVY